MSGRGGTNGNGTAPASDEGRAATEKIEVGLLEKRLEGLRDTQESVQGLSLWCQANKKHSTAIIDTWLKVLRKSKPTYEIIQKISLFIIRIMYGKFA